MVAGASGFIGGKLTLKLAAAGFEVQALSRNPGDFPSPWVESISLDLEDRDSLEAHMRGTDAAFYLVHSMSGPGEFEEKDMELAINFAQAARSAGIGRIVYQGALGKGAKSAHLSSRQEVADGLRSSGIPTVELRAAVVLGSGSASFEMLRLMSERLPVTPSPPWLQTRVEPIWVEDVLDYLIQSLDVPPGIYELGCGEVTTYRDMLHLYAKVRGLRRRPTFSVPFIDLRLSAYLVDLVTPLDPAVSHALVEGLTTEVIAKDRSLTRKTFGIEPMPLEAAMRRVLDDQASEIAACLFEEGRETFSNNVYWIRIDKKYPPGTAERVRRDLGEIGRRLADRNWSWAERARLLIGLLLRAQAKGGRDRIAGDEPSDWWIVQDEAEDHLILRSHGWQTGEGWLGYSNPAGSQRIRIAAAFRPRGLSGFLYWRLFVSVYRIILSAVIAARIRRAESRGPPRRPDCHQTNTA